MVSESGLPAIGGAQNPDGLGIKPITALRLKLRCARSARLGHRILAPTSGRRTPRPSRRRGRGAIAQHPGAVDPQLDRRTFPTSAVRGGTDELCSCLCYRRHCSYGDRCLRSCLGPSTAISARNESNTSRFGTASIATLHSDAGRDLDKRAVGPGKEGVGQGQSKMGRGRAVTSIGMNCVSVGMSGEPPRSLH
jgi:hypothetical protein